MMKFLRSQSQTVLIVVLGVIAIGFLFYGNAGNLLTNTGPRASNDYGRIDGQDISMAELSDAVRDAKHSIMLSGQGQVLRQPGVGPAIANYAWERLLLEREAQRLHIVISDRELVDSIRNQPIFQKDGAYSPEAYEKFVGEFRNALRLPGDSGIDPINATKNVLESVFRNDLTTDAVRKVLFSSVRSPAGDVAAQYQKYYGTVTASVATLDPKTFAATVPVTPAEIEAEYKAHPENPDYRTKEKRKVDYVIFLLSAEQQKLPEAQKAATKATMGQKALDFALALQPPEPSTGAAPEPVPEFTAQAKKMGLSVATTGFFDVESAPAGLPPSTAFNNAAFALTKDNPTSKLVEMDNGVAVLHLAEIQPSDLRPLDEVKSVIASQLQQTKGAAAAKAAASADLAKLKAETAKGTDFKKAATALGLKVETLPAFSPMNSQRADPMTQAVAYGTLSLAPGDISQPLPGPGDSYLLAHVDSRAAADPAGLAAFEKRYRDGQDSELRNEALADWANWKNKQPGTHRPPDLDAFGSVE